MRDFPFQLSEAEWRARLSPEEYRVLRAHGTEAPGSCGLLWEKRAGHYHCAGCDALLFATSRKFDSGTGWPSFQQAAPDAVLEQQDSSFGMIRTEVLCATCGSHLGHVFPDGPPPTGLRYCINGVALAFKADTETD